MIQMNFTWKVAKASHAVLLCRMEQPKVTSWFKTDKIVRIQHANAQTCCGFLNSHPPTHPTPPQKKKIQKKIKYLKIPTNQCHVSTLITISAIFSKHHVTKSVFNRHICSSHFAQDGKISTHRAVDCKAKH